MDLPTHPLLRPGARVTRRGDGLLQVGLHDPVIVRDEAAVRAALTALESGASPDLSDLATARLCRELADHGLIVDGDALMADVSAAAVHAAAGLGAARALEQRARLGVEVVGPDDVVTRARSWLPAVVSGAPAAVTLLVSVGVQPRHPVDELLRPGLPHLLLSTVEGVVELGPFVAPGQTACLRCVDAHRGETDPRRALVLEQYAAAGPRADGVPEPVDEPVFTAALAWAVRDCLSYADGLEPTTWSRTITFGRGMAQTAREWPRHPHCGCAWSEVQAG